MSNPFAVIIGVAAGLLLVGATHGSVPARAWNAITPEGVLKHIRVLASDEFEGRGVATGAEEKTVDYIVNACQALKLEPGNPDGTYVQRVALWGITADGGEVAVKAGDGVFPLAATDYTVSSAQPEAMIGIQESQIVFVGYGVVAPEYGWDDYKGLDVKGKAVLMLGGDPPITDPKDATKLDPKMFLGSELSYYGRAAAKADIAKAHGATAVITLTGEPAGRLPVRPPGANAGPNRFVLRESMIVRDASSTDRIGATIALQFEKAVALFASFGLDLNAMREGAVSREFKPVALRRSRAACAIVCARSSQERAQKSKAVIPCCAISTSFTQPLGSSRAARRKHLPWSK